MVIHRSSNENFHFQGNINIYLLKKKQELFFLFSYLSIEGPKYLHGNTFQYFTMLYEPDGI